MGKRFSICRRNKNKIDKNYIKKQLHSYFILLVHWAVSSIKPTHIKLVKLLKSWWFIKNLYWSMLKIWWCICIKRTATPVLHLQLHLIRQTKKTALPTSFNRTMQHMEKNWLLAGINLLINILINDEYRSSKRLNFLLNPPSLKKRHILPTILILPLYAYAWQSIKKC